MNFMTMRLEDGEQVIRLRGCKRLGWKSSHPHAGIWGAKTHYVLVPCRSTRSVNQKVTMALRSFVGLTDRSSDAEVLLLGSPEVIEALITTGPRWCRARISKAGRPRTAAQLAHDKRLATL
jgi:hypothetical protein